MKSRYPQYRPVHKSLPSLLCFLALVAGSTSQLLPASAASPAAGTVIENQATGSFIDNEDTANTVNLIESNTVQVAIAEVAGVIADIASITDAPTGVPNAGPFQSIAGIHNGDIAYFDFTITNKGNDPTQFFLPSTATINGGTLDSTGIQIIAYSDGTTTTNFDGLNSRPSPVVVPNGGKSTGGTNGLLTGLVVANNGSILPDGSIRVRVPVKVTAAAGSPVTVLLGDTPSDSASGSNPQARLQNQSVTTPTTSEIYTIDNADPAINPNPPDSTKETMGAPANGIRETSAIAATTILVTPTITVSGKVFHDADADVTINGSEAGTNAGSGTLTIYAIDAAGKVIDKATVNNNGLYTLSNIPASANLTLRISNDSSLNIGANAPTAPSLPAGWFHTGENLNGTIDFAISTLGDIALNNTTNLTEYNFGIRQSYVLPNPTTPTTCAANFTTTLNTGITATGGQVDIGKNDLNWTAEWLAGPNSGNGSPYAPPRPVGVMPAVVTGNLAPGAWVNEPTGVRWISYPFRLLTNSNGNHRDADLDGVINESSGSGANTSDTVRLKFTAKLTLPSNANAISVSLPVGVSADNQFVSFKVNGVENLIPTPAQNPQVQDYKNIQSLNIQNGWQPGVNNIEIIVDSGPDRVGFFLAVQASSIQFCPNVLLVKRITAVNNNTSTLNGQNLAIYNQDESNPYDDNTIEPTLAPTTSFPNVDTDKWPNTTGKTSSTFLLGGLNGGTIKPNDSIEYTIYFLSTGASTAKNVMFCDLVPNNLTFIPNAFNSLTAETTGLTGVERGIAINLGGTTKSYTNATDGDIAQYFPPGINPTSVFPSVNCGGSNTNGAIVVNLGNIPNATAPGIPSNSYGFVRFQGRVK